MLFTDCGRHLTTYCSYRSVGSLFKRHTARKRKEKLLMGQPTGGYDQLVKPRVQDLPAGREPRLSDVFGNFMLKLKPTATGRPTKSGPPNQRSPGTLSLKKLKHHRRSGLPLPLNLLENRTYHL